MSDYLNFLNENQTYNDLNDYASQAQQTYKDVSEQIKDTKLEGLIFGMPEVVKLVSTIGKGINSFAGVSSKGLDAYANISDTVENVADTIGETVSRNVPSVLSDAVSGVSNYVRDVGKSLSDRLNTKSFETDPEDFMGDGISNDMGLVDRFQSVFRGSGNVGEAGSGIGDTLSNIGSEIASKASSAVEGVVSQATGAVEGAVSQATGAVEGAVSQATGAIEGGLSKVTGAIEGGTSEASSAVSNVASSLGESIGETVGEVAGAGLADVIPVIGEIAMVGLSLYDIFKPSGISDPISYGYSAPSFVAGV
jgi:phage-related protein